MIIQGRQLFRAVLYKDNYFVPCYMKTIISCRVIWRQLFRAGRVCFIADIGLHVYYSRCVSTMWLVQINSSTNGCSKWHLLKASACINEMQGPCSSTSQKTQMIFTCSSHQKCKDNCKFLTFRMFISFDLYYLLLICSVF